MSSPTRPNLMRVRGFAAANPSDDDDDDDNFRDTSGHHDGNDASMEEGGEEVGGGGEDDQYPAASILKLPSFFLSSNRLLVNAHDEAERQAKQQQTQNYEAVMKRFQVRRVAVRAFSTSNVSSHTTTRGSPPTSSGHSLAHTPGRRETEPALQSKDDLLEKGEHDAVTQQHQRSRQQRHNSAEDMAAQPVKSIPAVSIRSVDRHSVPSTTGSQRRSRTKGYAHSYPPESKRSTRFTLHRFVVKKKRRMLRRLRRFITNLSSVIYPTSTFQRVREGVLVNLFVVQLILLPLLPIYFPKEKALIMGLQFVSEWIYFLDCALGFNTAFFRKTTNELVTNRREIASHYFCGWFAMDILSSIPINTVVYLASADHQGLFELSALTYLFIDNVARIPRFVSFFRMLQALRTAARALKAGQNFWTWVLLYSRYSHLLRVAILVFMVMLLEHYMACFWQYLTPPPAPGTAEISALELYLRNFYLVVLLVHGQSVNTASVAQTIYSISAVFLGSFVVAIVFGNVAMLVSNFNSSATNYQRNMEKVFATMKKMKLPPELQDRIHQFFTHLWQEYDSVDADLVKFPKELTPTLALEVGLCKYMNLITGVSYWRECSPDFVSHVIRNLVVRVYLPDDFVLRRREINHDLFMINRGTCELTHPSPEAEFPKGANELQLLSTLYVSRQASAVSPSALKFHKKHTKFHHSVRESDASSSGSPFGPELLRPGEVFGGMGLLLNYEQQFNVRAVTHVEMCVLSRHEFQKILMRFQHDRPTVLTALLEDVILKNELPFSMEDVFGVSVVDEEQSSAEMVEAGAGTGTDLDLSRSPAALNMDQRPQTNDSKTQLTPSEAAHFLMKKINHEGVDPSIKFGFQQVDLPPKSQDLVVQNEESTERVEQQEELIPAPSTRFASFSSAQPVAATAATPTEPSVQTQTVKESSSSHDECELRLASTDNTSSKLPGLPQYQHDRRRSSSSHRRRSSAQPVVVPEQLAHLQVEMTSLTTRVEGVEGSQAFVLSALEALQQSVARIKLNVMTQPSSHSHLPLRRAASTDTERSDLRVLRQERSMHKILSLPSNWEASGDAHQQQQQDDTLGGQMQSSFSRSGFRLRVSRAMPPRSHTGLTPKEFVPEKPESSRTRSSAHPSARRASMFPRRSPVLASKPSLVKKRELLADSLWTQYPSPK